MSDDSKTREELIQELQVLRTRISEMGEAETSRHQKDDALRESEKLYRTLIETSPDPIIMYDLKGELITANKRAADTYGVPTVADLLQELKTVFDLLTEESKPIAQASMLQILTGEAPDGDEYRIKLRGGRIIITELRSSLVRTADGKPQAFISVARDITERKRLEEELCRSEERYRTMLEDIDEGYFENDLEGNLTFVNDSMCRHLGYTREELIGMNYRQYNDESFLKIVRDVFTEIYQTGKPSQKYHAIYINKNGEKHFSEASGSLMRNAGGEPVGFRGIVRNIDDRKKAEEEREKLIAELQLALSKIETLSGLLPICAYCKKIRDDAGYWNQIESYITEHSKAEFSHGICPDCLQKIYPELYQEIFNKK